MARFEFVSATPMLENLRAASAPRAGYFSLLVQRKVTKRKHAPEPPVPCASRPGRPLAELAERTQRASGSTPARDFPRPGLRCLAAATGPNVKTGSRRLGRATRSPTWFKWYKCWASLRSAQPTLAATAKLRNDEKHRIANNPGLKEKV